MIEMMVEENRRRITNRNVTSICHIFREGNQEEDGMANLGVQNGRNQWWDESLPLVI